MTSVLLPSTEWPARLRVPDGVALPLVKTLTSNPVRSTGNAPALKTSSALLLPLPSTYSEKKTAPVAAEGPAANAAASAAPPSR